MLVVCERWVGDGGQTATYWPNVLLTIAALLSHSGWAAQPWVTEGPPSAAGSQFGILSPTDPNCNWNWLTQAVCGTWLHNCPMSPASCGRTHLPPSPNSITSTGQGDIPISSTGCTCFTVLPLISTGASLDWRFGRGSICNTSVFLFLLQSLHTRIHMHPFYLHIRIFAYLINNQPLLSE